MFMFLGMVILSIGDLVTFDVSYFNAGFFASSFVVLCVCSIIRDDGIATSRYHLSTLALP